MRVTRSNVVRFLTAILLAALAMLASSSGAAVAKASPKNSPADMYDEVLRSASSRGSCVEREPPGSAASHC